MFSLEKEFSQLISMLEKEILEYKKKLTMKEMLSEAEYYFLKGKVSQARETIDRIEMRFEGEEV